MPGRSPEGATELFPEARLQAELQTKIAGVDDKISKLLEQWPVAKQLEGEEAAKFAESLQELSVPEEPGARIKEAQESREVFLEGEGWEAAKRTLDGLRQERERLTQELRNTGKKDEDIEASLDKTFENEQRKIDELIAEGLPPEEAKAIKNMLERGRRGRQPVEREEQEAA